MKRLFYFLIFVLSVLGAVFIYKFTTGYFDENKILREVINRLEADSRIAEVLVTGVYYDESQKKTFTTINFLEYDSKGNTLEPRYFTFPGNIIQFQSLVVRFKDINIRKNDLLRGKSAYLFWKVFMLDGPNTVEYDITKVNDIPKGYKLENINNSFEAKLWERFWAYALELKEAEKMGIKNAQIESPGTMFIPGTLYTIKIEHDGGMRIDTTELPHILKGEYIPKK